ncbi:hypothetical protein OT109_11390 [Phycisphaeraceae bacterium D3-23]
MIAFTCPSCQKPYSVEDRYAGKATQCKQCGVAMTVPGASAPPAAQPAPYAAATLQPAQPTGNGAATGLGVASLVLGVIALLASWIPFIGCISVPFAVIGFVLATIGGILALTTKGRGIGLPIAGGVACVLSVGVWVGVSMLTTTALQHAGTKFMNDVEYHAAVARLELLRGQVAALEVQAIGMEQAGPAPGMLLVTERSVAWGAWEGRDVPVLTLRVTNMLDQPVYGADFQGTVTSPDAQEPWVDAEVSYADPEGLAPGEKATWVVRPDPNGPWGQTPRGRDDLVLLTTPLGLMAQDGGPLSPGPSDAGTAQALEDLRREIEQLEQEAAAYEAANPG